MRSLLIPYATPGLTEHRSLIRLGGGQTVCHRLRHETRAILSKSTSIWHSQTCAHMQCRYPCAGTALGRCVGLRHLLLIAHGDQRTHSNHTANCLDSECLTRPNRLLSFCWKPTGFCACAVHWSSRR